MKDPIFEEDGITSIHFQIAYLYVHRVDLPFRKSEGAGFALTAAGHQSHAAIGLMEIRQTVTDLNAYQRQRFVPQVTRDPDIPMPSTSKGWRFRAFRSLIDECMRMQVNIGAEQLNDERDGRTIGDQIEERFFSK